MKFFIKALCLTFLLLPLRSLMAATVWVPLDQLAPTQINIGELAMRDKVEKIKDKADSGKLLEYLHKKPAPAFIGPDQRYYIIDRHHTARALYEAPVSFKKFKVHVLKDLSNLNWADFYSFMLKGHYFYLYDQGVGPQRPQSLPRYLWHMTDDPYRSLAWLVREEGGFDKAPIPYLEFMWANFFRKRIPLKGARECHLLQVLDDAYDLSQSDEASSLPGFNGEDGFEGTKIPRLLHSF